MTPLVARKSHAGNGIPKIAFVEPFTKLPKNSFHTGLESTALSEFDETGITATITRFSLAALNMTKDPEYKDTVFHGGIALSGDDAFPEQEILEACMLVEDLPCSFATKFLLFPTAFLARLMQGHRLDKVQEWWLSASLRELAKCCFSSPAGSLARNVAHRKTHKKYQTMALVECTIHDGGPQILHSYGKLKRTNWEKWDESLMHSGKPDYDVIYGNNGTLGTSPLVRKSVNGQVYPWEPLSSTRFSNEANCTKTVECMPSWAGKCLGAVYSSWRHLIIFCHSLDPNEKEVQIGTIWDSGTIDERTWPALCDALANSLRTPWLLKNQRSLGTAADQLWYYGPKNLANMIMAGMAVYGELRLEGEENCLTAHLDPTCGVRVHVVARR